MDSHIIEKIKTGDKEALGEVYLKFRKEFILGIRKRYSGVKYIDEIAKDVYQEAIEILYNNIRDNKPVELNKIGAYIFSIGKNKISEIIRKKSKYIQYVDLENLNRVHEDEQNKEAKFTRIENALSNLTKTNRKILNLFYYENKDINEISKMLELNYDSVKSMKSRALKELLYAYEGLEMKSLNAVE